VGIDSSLHGLEPAEEFLDFIPVTPAERLDGGGESFGLEEFLDRFR